MKHIYMCVCVCTTNYKNIHNEWRNVCWSLKQAREQKLELGKGKIQQNWADYIKNSIEIDKVFKAFALVQDFKEDKYEDA